MIRLGDPYGPDWCTDECLWCCLKEVRASFCWIARVDGMMWNPCFSWVVVSNILYFHPYLGKWSNMTSIFFRWVGSTTSQETPFLCQEVDEKPGQPLLQVGDCIQEAASSAMMMEQLLFFWGETPGFLVFGVKKTTWCEKYRNLRFC